MVKCKTSLSIAIWSSPPSFSFYLGIHNDLHSDRRSQTMFHIDCSISVCCRLDSVPHECGVCVFVTFRWGHCLCRLYRPTCLSSATNPDLISVCCSCLKNDKALMKVAVKPKIIEYWPLKLCCVAVLLLVSGYVNLPATKKLCLYRDRGGCNLSTKWT